jgi:hypothetical protein
LPHSKNKTNAGLTLQRNEVAWDEALESKVFQDTPECLLLRHEIAQKSQANYGGPHASQ